MGFGELEGFGAQMDGSCFWRLKEKEDIWLVPVLSAAMGLRFYLWLLPS